MDTKTRRWSLRVTPAQDMLVRRVLEATGMSLNEYVVGCAVTAAADHLADRRVFTVSPQVWEELQEILDRPPEPKTRIAALLDDPSVLSAVRRERRRIIGAQLASAPLDADDKAVLDASVSECRRS